MHLRPFVIVTLPSVIIVNNLLSNVVCDVDVHVCVEANSDDARASMTMRTIRIAIEFGILCFYVDICDW